MDLLKNPFYLLKATTRDNRRRITELAEELSLQADSDDCIQARSDLMNPQKRLSAEIAWLPGVSLKNANAIIPWVSNPSSSVPQSIEKAPALVAANILAGGLLRLKDSSGPKLTSEWILRLALAFEEVDPEEVRLMINEDRVVSGFPEVRDLSMVEAEIRERRLYYRQIIKSALDRLPPKDRVQATTIVIASATDNGGKLGPSLIYDLVDSYEVAWQSFLGKEAARIEELANNIKLAAAAGKPDPILRPMISQIIKVVKNWDAVAQPIQVATLSRGHNHEASQNVAGFLRKLAVQLHNEHNKLDFSRCLTKILQEVFAEVAEVAERTAEDATALEEIAKSRIHQKANDTKQKVKWAREITYQAEIGIIFKDKLRISPEGIEWKKRLWNLDSITRVRWGGTSRSVNGIPSGTTYNILFGTNAESCSIQLDNQAIFSSFIERLWKAVGVRLLIEYLIGFRDGKQYRLGDSMIDDRGIELEREKFFTANERVFCHWREVACFPFGGSFNLKKRNDNSFSASFSYQNVDNVHVFEAAIRRAIEHGDDRLSGLLGE